MAELQIKDVELLRLRPGDLLVVRLPEDTHPDTLAIFQKALRDKFTALGLKNVEGIIISASREQVDFTIVRTQEET